MTERAGEPETMTFELGRRELDVLRDWQEFTHTPDLYWALFNMIYHCDADRVWMTRHPSAKSRVR